MKNHKRILSLALAFALALALVPTAALAVSPTDALADVAYYGEVSRCTMSSDQALAFAKLIRSETEALEREAVRSVATDGPGSVYTYAALVDLGGGKPALFFAGGKVTEWSWMSAESIKKSIRTDGCDWDNVGQYGVWEYKDGVCRKLSMPRGGRGLTYNGSYIFVAGEVGSDGSSYDGRVYPLGSGTLSDVSTRALYSSDEGMNYKYTVDGQTVDKATFAKWKYTWDPTTNAPMGHYVDGGVGGSVWGMASALATADALTKYAEIKEKFAYAATQTVSVDGEKVEFQCYALKDENGNPSNYVKLRDLAYALNGTAAQFQVDWDGAAKSITLTSGMAYTPNGSENSTPYSGDQVYAAGSAKLIINGEAVSLKAFTLKNGGFTYFKLRDLGKALGFNVGWTAERGMFIESDKPYDSSN